MSLSPSLETTRYNACENCKTAKKRCTVPRTHESSDSCARCLKMGKVCIQTQQIIKKKPFVIFQSTPEGLETAVRILNSPAFSPNPRHLNDWCSGTSQGLSAFLDQIERSQQPQIQGLRELRSSDTSASSVDPMRISFLVD